MATTVEVFVNDDEDGPCVALMLTDISLVEVDGDLRPVVEFTAGPRTVSATG